MAFLGLVVERLWQGCVARLWQGCVLSMVTIVAFSALRRGKGHAMTVSQPCALGIHSSHGLPLAGIEDVQAVKNGKAGEAPQLGMIGRWQNNAR